MYLRIEYTYLDIDDLPNENIDAVLVELQQGEKPLDLYKRAFPHLIEDIKKTHGETIILKKLDFRCEK